MSRIGVIGKLNIASVLKRIEVFTKTGLLVIKQDTQWVEFYCREGKLLCIGPIRTDATLGERLLHDGVISLQVLQETMFAISDAVPSETRIALTLMDLGYVKREELRTWAAQKAEESMRTVFAWTSGDIYFEENSAPPAERLLVALAISALLAAIKLTNAAPQVAVYSPAAQSVAREQSPVVDAVNSSNSIVKDASQTPTLFDASQFFMESAQNSLQTPSASPYISAGALLPSFGDAVTTGPIVPSATQQAASPMPPVPVTTLPSAPRRWIDTSFMQPEMVLIAGDMSTLQEQQVQITPAQWQLLTRVDGHTSLQDVCDALHLGSDQVCQVAGELIAEQVVSVVPPLTMEPQEMSPASRNIVNSGLSNGLAAPGYAATTQTPWGNALPSSTMGPQFSPTLETQSQWGNGGNGATFVHGQGWVASMQPLQPLQSNGFGASGIYASIEGRR